MLLHYIRGKNRERIGIVVALDHNKIGWSRCHLPLDKFDLDKGLKIATGRAQSGKNWEAEENVPYDVRIEIEKMHDRASRYFKLPPNTKYPKYFTSKEEYDKDVSLSRQWLPKWLKSHWER